MRSTISHYLGNAIAHPLLCVAILLTSCNTARLDSNVDPQGISISEDGLPVLFFQVQPKSFQGQYERAGYVHPLYSLDGTVITEDFPEDHRHQHGIFTAWHQILVGDSAVANGWMGDNISWRVANVETTRGNSYIRVSGEILWWVSLEGKSEAIAKEIVNVTVHESRDGQRVIDYDFRLVQLIDDLRVGGADNDKGYGGFSLRFNLPPDIMFVARGGEVEPKSEPVEAGPWMNMIGSFDGTPAKSGVLVLTHPSNPGHPEPWILRRQKSMQNPVFPGRVPVSVGKEGLGFRYRLIIHRDGMDNTVAEKAYQVYSQE